MAGRVALTLRCPENNTPGLRVAVPLPGGGEHEVPVPEDAVPGEELPGDEADEAAPKRLKARVALCPALYGLPTIKMK